MYVCLCYVDTLIMYNVLEMDMFLFSLPFMSLVFMNYELG